MTVHGSKGLQSPVVILADACADPDRKGGGFHGNFANISLDPTASGSRSSAPQGRARRARRVQLAAQDRLEREEHWRLLYVALTRAEERLYIGGALGPADRKGPPAASWWTALDWSLRASAPTGPTIRIGAAPAASAIPKSSPRLREPRRRIPSRPTGSAAPRRSRRGRRGRSRRRRSARTTSPIRRRPGACGRRRSAAGCSTSCSSGFPTCPPGSACVRAESWLERSAGIEDEALRRALARMPAGSSPIPAHADLFGPGALAEAPIAAVVGEGVVVSGSVDRLLVGPTGSSSPISRPAAAPPPRSTTFPVPHLARWRPMRGAEDHLPGPADRGEIALHGGSGPVRPAGPDLLDRASSGA
jgi:ATP-dependent helicase/nuclease subunit A